MASNPAPTVSNTTATTSGVPTGNIPAALSFATQKRSQTQILANHPKYDRALRNSVSVPEKLKIMEKATTGSTSKLRSIVFEFITAEGDSTKFESSLEVDSFLAKLESHLH